MMNSKGDIIDVISEKFESDEMGDDMDFFDWSATWDMYQSVETSLEVLELNYVLS